jgi:hypothetical protein
MTVIGVLEMLPPLIIGPLLRRLCRPLPEEADDDGVDGTRAGLALIIPLLYAADVLTLTALYVFVFIMALVSTVLGPALPATIPLIVERSQFTAANALGRHDRDDGHVGRTRPKRPGHRHCGNPGGAVREQRDVCVSVLSLKKWRFGC